MWCGQNRVFVGNFSGWSLNLDVDMTLLVDLICVSRRAEGLRVTVAMIQ